MNYEVHLVKGSMLVLILIIMFLLVIHMCSIHVLGTIDFSLWRIDWGRFRE